MMARLMDDDNLVRVVTNGFLEDVPRRIAALKGYLDSIGICIFFKQNHWVVI
jgi:hypothetical protein